MTIAEDRTAAMSDLTAPAPAYPADTLAGWAADYHEQGYVHVPGVLSAEEAAGYRAETQRVIAQLANADPTWGSAADLNGGKPTSLKHVHDAQFYSGAFSRLLVDPRFTDIAAAVLGTPNVQLHHTKAFIKPPENGSPFPMHQDYPFFPHTHHRMGAVIFFFDDAPVEKGCLRVVPGSHRSGPRQHDATGGYHLPEVPISDAIDLPAKAGDAVFFTYLTVHGSGVNVSDEIRTTWLVQFRDPADPPAVRAHEFSLGQGMILAGVDPTGRKGPKPPEAGDQPAMMGGPAPDAVMGTMNR